MGVPDVAVAVERLAAKLDGGWERGSVSAWALACWSGTARRATGRRRTARCLGQFAEVFVLATFQSVVSARSMAFAPTMSVVENVAIGREQWDGEDNGADDGAQSDQQQPDPGSLAQASSLHAVGAAAWLFRTMPQSPRAYGVSVIFV